MKSALVLLALLSAAAWGEAPKVPDEPHFGSPCPYPAAALAASERGTTLISYRGTDAGRIENVKVVHSSGYADLDEASVQCAGRWRFDPDAPADKFYRGEHTTNIDWEPKSAPQGEAPAGKSIGRPHMCFQYYPEAEAKAGIEGTTTLRFTITDEGKVRDLAVDISSGNEHLDKAALRCARYWRYIPAIEDKKPVAVPWKATVQWRLETPKIPDFAEPPPDCLHSVAVRPEELAGIPGVTEVRFSIVRGGVEDVEIAQSSGNRALDRAAAACIAKRRYVRDTVVVDGREVDRYRMTLAERIDWHRALEPAK